MVLNSLAPGGFAYNLKLVNFKLISMMKIASIFYEITIWWMPHHLTDHWSTLVQVMAWCRQAASHYLSQCCPSSPSPFDINGPQWVNCSLWGYMLFWVVWNKMSDISLCIQVPVTVSYLYHCTPWWSHQIETFFALLALCVRKSRHW